MISVALCTYNGEKFIEEQLRSIINQSMMVDEIVVCDDGSTDNTIAIVEQVSNDFPQVCFNIQRNETNLGFARNFEKAIGLCRGDIVFLSDQDDVWKINKVETIVKWFAENPTMDTVFTDAELIDENGNPFTDKSLFYCWGFDEKARGYFDNGYAFELFTIENRATGATMAFRKSAVDGLSFDVGGLPHDHILALRAICNNSLGYVEGKLISYRIHLNQQIGVCDCLKSPTSNVLFLQERWYLSCVSDSFCDKYAEEARFIEWRRTTKHSFMGFIKVLLRMPTYKRLYTHEPYPSLYKSFMLFDLRQSWLHLLNRLKGLIRKK